MKTILALKILLFSSLSILSVTGLSSISQTIPSISVSSANAIPGCSPIIIEPGTVQANSAGFITGICPNGKPAITLSGTETPSFVLPLGFIQASIVHQAIECSFPSSVQTGRIITANLTSGSPIVFSGSPVGYNYCLFYQNPPLVGIQSFTITWSP